MEQLFYVRQLIKKYREKKNNLTIVFICLEKAYVGSLERHCGVLKKKWFQ